MTIADIFAVGQTLTFRGKTYTLRKPTLIEQGMFQRWLEQRTHDAIDRGVESEDKKDRRHDRVYADSAQGKYEWDGPLALEALWTPAGMAKSVAIVLRDQGVTDELAEEMVKEQIKKVAAIMLVSAADDPKALAPVLDALGLPSDWLQSAPNAPFFNNSSTPPSSEPLPNSGDSPTINSSFSTQSSAAPMG